MFNDAYYDSSSDSYFGEHLSLLLQKNFNRVIFATITVNSVRNNFALLVYGINDYTDVLMISETRLGDNYPSIKFHIKGYIRPFRLDCDAYGDGILVFVREDIPCKHVLMKNSFIEAFFIELNLERKKSLHSQIQASLGD